jgi:hypothetical protein
MKRLLIFAFLISSLCLAAENWKKSGDFNLLLSQSYYSENWNGTETGNVNWAAGFNFVMAKQLNNFLYDQNTLLLSFGQTHYQEIDTDGDMSWKKPQITTDKIDYENLLTFTLQKFVDPFISFRWESQFYDDKSNPEDAYYINPNILTLSMGANKILIDKDKQNLQTRLGAAFKNYLNQDENIDYQNNAGLEFVASYWLLFNANSGKFDSKLRAYQALLTSDEDEEGNWQALDVEFINSLSFKLYSYIGIKLYLEMLYDKEEIDEVRWQENIGVNLSYSLF